MLGSMELGQLHVLCDADAMQNHWTEGNQDSQEQ